MRLLTNLQPSLVCRAPKPSLPDVGSFEDLLAQARQQGGAAPAAGEEQQGGSDAAPADRSPGGSSQEDGAAAAAAQAQQQGVGAGEEGDDLLIMDSDEEGGEGVRLVDLPASTRKKQQERMPWITQVGWGWEVHAGCWMVSRCSARQPDDAEMQAPTQAACSMLRHIFVRCCNRALSARLRLPMLCRWTATRTKS